VVIKLEEDALTSREEFEVKPLDKNPRLEERRIGGTGSSGGALGIERHIIPSPLGGSGSGGLCEEDFSTRIPGQTALQCTFIASEPLVGIHMMREDWCKRYGISVVHRDTQN